MTTGKILLYVGLTVFALGGVIEAIQNKEYALGLAALLLGFANLILISR